VIDRDDAMQAGREAAAPTVDAVAAGAAPSDVEFPLTAPAAARRAVKHVSLQTVERLSVYRRVLEELDRDGTEYIHSQQLADTVGVTPAQLRRDLASFGTFGNISRGYNVYQMSRTIGRILGTDETQTVALFGVGDLGRALLSYRGFEERGFHIAAAFDVDAAKVGRVYAGRRCYHVDELETVMLDFEARMAVLATRPEGLQTLVDRIAAAGVHAILNFVPKLVKAPAGCFVEHTDITAKLELLSFLVGASASASGTADEATRAEGDVA
jgi:redox-sensing transcriptional repressor